MDKKSQKEKGITLVALVVTVIVLMILAGITLTLVLGQNGIIGKAQQAKSLSQNSQNAEQEGLNSLYNELIDATKGPELTVATTVGKTLSDTDNIPIKDANGNTVTIPAGFKIADGSPTKQEEGIVVEDKDENQFVWIPVASTANYIRTDFGSSIDAGGYSSYSETIPSDEQASINTYHGYYIGRYEAGDSVATVNKTLRASGASVTNKVAIKKGQAPYSYVTRDQSNILATGMKTAEGYKATTKLCSSYAWDTAINLIQKTVSNYGTSSNQGNYNDTTFTYTDITGASQTKAASSNALIPTGQTTPACNIYDMGGNAWEWTTEVCNYSINDTCVWRGGFCNDSSTSYPAGCRGYNTTSYSVYCMGFRITLYM